MVEDRATADHKREFALVGSISFTHSLPETSNLPSVFIFAECIPSGTRRTSSLPSAELKTLGKEKHSTNRGFAEYKKHSAKRGFAEC